MKIIPSFSRVISLSLLSRSLSTVPPSLSTQKYCKDCKFFITNRRECALFSEADLVTGIKSYQYASTIRNNDNKCGKDAIFFEENQYKVFTVLYYFIADYWLLFSTVGLSAIYMVSALSLLVKK